MKNVVFWDVALCGSCKNRPFVATFLPHQYVLGLLVSTNILTSSPILITLMMKVISSAETSVLTGATCHNIPVEGILIN
jgi:hypothetical protein